MVICVMAIITSILRGGSMMKIYVLLLSLVTFFVGGDHQLFASDGNKQKLITSNILSAKERQLLDETIKKRESVSQATHNPLFGESNQASLPKSMEEQLNDLEISALKKDKH